MKKNKSSKDSNDKNKLPKRNDLAGAVACYLKAEAAGYSEQELGALGHVLAMLQDRAQDFAPAVLAEKKIRENKDSY